MHTKNIIKQQTFEFKAPEVQSTREQPRFGEHLRARPEGEHDFGRKRF